ncbi:MAG: hypothetical protein V7K47_20130 [Nostoc sp.]
MTSSKIIDTFQTTSKRIGTTQDHRAIKFVEGIKIVINGDVRKSGLADSLIQDRD